jgi:hypothetical protein
MYSYKESLYNFNKNFKYFINYTSNIIWVQINFKYFILKLPSYYFIKQENKNLKLLFLTKFHYITFLKHFFNFYNNLFCFYYYTLKLKGLGYRVFNVTKKLIKIFLNRSNFFYLHIPSNVLLKYRTRKFFFLSTDYNTLKVMILYLLFLKEFVIYRLNGIYYTRQIILIKPGKNKFR